MATHSVAFGIIKIEDSPSPEPLVVTLEPVHVANPVPSPIDPRDPEGFLRRCSGFNKKTKLRCNSVIGQKSQQNCHPTFLPTCRSHRDQQTYAGWCQYQYPNGERCSRLFRWRPPHFELCTEHEGHPDTPCYFFRLPLEIRQEILRLLLPSGPIGSSTATLHNDNHNLFTATTSVTNYSMNLPLPPHVYHTGQPWPGATLPLVPPPPPPPPPPLRHIPSGISNDPLGRRPVHRMQAPGHQSTFPMPVIDLFLVNRQFYQEVKDVLFSSAAFTIDVRKDGTFMCGRRLLEPRRADGSSHYIHDETDETKQRFLKYFDWSAVKKYRVDILVENWADQVHVGYPSRSTWDEEVELYDIRDYISVVVSGVLAKSKNLCKLQVRLCLSDFDWSHEQTLANTKIILGPFERLRNVRQPQLVGVYQGRPFHNMMITIQRTPTAAPRSMAQVCSVPEIPTDNPLLASGIPDFDKYCSNFARWISSTSSSSVTSKPPIRAMFTEFKDFYSNLSSVVATVSRLSGRMAFLHRARVAREQEDVESFREIRNELIGYWYSYLEGEEIKKKDIDARMSRMLDTDIYPSHEWEGYARSPMRQSSPCAESPVLLNSAKLALEGIPHSGNTHVPNVPSMQNMMRSANMIGTASSLSQSEQQQLLLEQQQRKTRILMAQLARQRAQQAAIQQAVQERAQQRAQHLQAVRQRRAQHFSQYVTTTFQNRPGGLHRPHSRNRFQQSQQCPLRAVKQEEVGPNAEMEVEMSEDNLSDCGAPSDPQKHCDGSPSLDDLARIHDMDEIVGELDVMESDSFGHVGLSSGWYTIDDDAQPGPSSKRRRTDSGYSDSAMQEESAPSPEPGSFKNHVPRDSPVVGEASVEQIVYHGKGKGKVGVTEVIYLD